jgi:hypothetical protein
MPNLDILNACDHLENLVSQLGGVSPEWEWGYSDEHTDEELIANFSESLRKTREHFSLPEKTRMWGVFPKSTDFILCQTGNSPTSERRAEFIASVNPQIIQQLIAYVREKEKECTHSK